MSDGTAQGRWMMMMELGPFGKAFMATNGVIFAIGVVWLSGKLLHSGTEWLRRVDTDEALQLLREVSTLGSVAVVALVFMCVMRWCGRRGY